ncbi:MAG: hypothetical protein QW735_01485 [archaeon]
MKEENKIKILEDQNRILSTIFNTWIYALGKVGGENEDFVRKVQAEAVQKWLNDRKVQIKAKTPLEACQKYIAFMDKEKFIPSERIQIEEKKGILKCVVRAPCTYRNICKAILDEGFEPYCFRIHPFITVIKLALNKTYEGLTVKIDPDEECVLLLGQAKT